MNYGRRLQAAADRHHASASFASDISGRGFDADHLPASKVRELFVTSAATGIQKPNMKKELNSGMRLNSLP